MLTGRPPDPHNPYLLVSLTAFGRHGEEAFSPMQTPDESIRPTAVRVLALEALVIVALWWLGHHFGGV